MPQTGYNPLNVFENLGRRPAVNPTMATTTVTDDIKIVDQGENTGAINKPPKLYPTLVDDLKSPQITDDESDSQGSNLDKLFKSPAASVSKTQAKKFDRWAEFFSDLTDQQRLQYCTTRLSHYAKLVASTIEGMYPTVWKVSPEKKD